MKQKTPRWLDLKMHRIGRKKRKFQKVVWIYTGEDLKDQLKILKQSFLINFKNLKGILIKRSSSEFSFIENILAAMYRIIAVATTR